MLQLVLNRDPADDAADFGIWTGYRVPDDRGEWHKLTQRLYEYWLAIAPAGRLPGRQHLAPEDIVPLWSRLFMLDVSRDPLRYRYRLCGTEIAGSLGHEVTGRWLDEVHPQLIANPLSRERFRFTAETGCPTWRRGPPLWSRHPDHRTLETCIVPLAADGHSVDQMVGVAVAFDATGRQI
jgi:hypothetical protein